MKLKEEYGYVFVINKNSPIFIRHIIIGNNIDRIADTEEDAETYIMAIEKAINTLVYKK